MNLAIEPELSKIAELVEQHQVVWIDIPTGAGKSIGIPKVLAESSGLRVFCTQPTIAAVTALHAFQKKSSKLKVGWAAEGSRKYKDADRIVYATAGHVRNVLLRCFESGKVNAQKLAFCDVLMVDEIHTGSKDNSMIIDLWCEALAQGAEVPKLVLSTATTTGLDSLLGRLGGVKYTSTLRHYKVEVRYSGKTYEQPDDDMMFVDAAHYAVDLLQTTRSHGIVFCSGSGECEDVAKKITDIISERNLEHVFMSSPKPLNIKVMVCFAQCTREEVIEAISEAPEGTVKVVCMTNIGESSLTVPDVRWVVDMMSEKRVSMRNDKFHLGVARISKNSADQRAGRTGRTVDGSVCVRMINEDDFGKLEEFRPLEMTNSPITDVIIGLLDVGLDPSKVIFDLSSERMLAAMRTLFSTGCVECVTVRRALPTVTDCGRFVSKLPMDVLNATSLFRYISENGGENLFWPLAIVTIIDNFGPSLLWFPRRNKDESSNDYQARIACYAQEHFTDFMGSNPVQTLCNVFDECMKDFPERDIYTPSWAFGKWSFEHSINNQKLKEIIVAMRRLSRILTEDGFNVQMEPLASAKDSVAKMFHIVNRVYGSTRALTKIYYRKGWTYIDVKGNPIIVDTVKVCIAKEEASDVDEKLCSLSEMQITSPKTRAITNICSLWIPFK